MLVLAQHALDGLLGGVRNQRGEGRDDHLVEPELLPLPIVVVPREATLLDDRRLAAGEGEGRRVVAFRKFGQGQGFRVRGHGQVAATFGEDLVAVLGADRHMPGLGVGRRGWREHTHKIVRRVVGEAEVEGVIGEVAEQVLLRRCRAEDLYLGGAWIAAVGREELERQLRRPAPLGQVDPLWPVPLLKRALGHGLGRVVEVDFIVLEAFKAPRGLSVVDQRPDRLRLLPREDQRCRQIGLLDVPDLIGRVAAAGGRHPAVHGARGGFALRARRHGSRRRDVRRGFCLSAPRTQGENEGEQCRGDG